MTHDTSTITCTVCTFENSALLFVCEMCGSDFFLISSDARGNEENATASAPTPAAAAAGVGVFASMLLGTNIMRGARRESPCTADTLKRPRDPVGHDSDAIQPTGQVKSQRQKELQFEQTQPAEQSAQRQCPFCTVDNPITALACIVCENRLDVAAGGGGGGGGGVAAAETVAHSPGAGRSSERTKGATCQQLKSPMAGTGEGGSVEDVRQIRAAKFTASKQPTSSASTAATAPSPSSVPDPSQGTCTGPRPSEVDWGRIDWLWVRPNPNPNTQEHAPNTQHTQQVVDKLLTRYNEGAGHEGHESVAKGALGSRELYNLATELVQSPDHWRASRSGKWLLMNIPKRDVDRLWGIVQKGVHDELLGPVAKVGPLSSGEFFMICVYTQDFTDKDDIHRVLRQLVELQLLRDNKAITYKADVITELAIRATGGSSTSVVNGTFYQGSLRGSEVVFGEPTHFNCNNGKGSKVRPH